MKRRYKHGDWFRVPLGGEHDAIGLITRMCRSRLFGYFFTIDSGADPGFAELQALRAQDAVACALFGGAGIEQARWRIIATSLRFDPAAWPFPQFASRGVFGRTWSGIEYDPETMSITNRASIGAEQAAALPDARFATPEELEALLRLRIEGETPDVPLSVYEARSPLQPERLRILERGGRVQFSETLTGCDLDVLENFIAEHPGVELRVHGIAEFDARALARFMHLRSLVLDVAAVSNAGALGALERLESFRLGRTAQSCSLEALERLPQLRRLELHGQNADVRVVERLGRLDSLALSATPAVAVDRLRSAHRLRALVLAHTETDVLAVSKLAALERLWLRGMSLTALPDFSHNANLRFIELRGVSGLHDLSPLASARALRALRIEGMRRLEMRDFEPLVRCVNLLDVTIDIGSKTKTREIYRRLRHPMSSGKAACDVSRAMW